ncbi:MAG: hypothetical protein ACXW3C_00560 [Pyrinomonadaceae bacterium]
MRTILAFLILPFIVSFTQNSSQKDSGLELLSLEIKTEVRVDKDFPRIVSDKPPVITPTLGRGTADATDTRNVADLKDKWEDRNQRMKSVDAAANKTEDPHTRYVHGVHIFKTRMRNNTAKTITRFVWAYHLPDSSPGAPSSVDSQYLCNVTLAPGEVKPIKVVSRVGRSMVINVSLPSPPAGPPTLDDMIINQIQFADNDKWQRSGWNSVILTQVGARKVGKGKCIEL